MKERTTEAQGHFCSYEYCCVGNYTHAFLFSGVFTEGANLYVSRKSGNDRWSCDLSKPCKSIARAVNKSSPGDHIYLNGANTDKDPYNCSTGSLYINKSLSFQRFGPVPQIRCLNWAIVDQSANNLEMNVNLLELFFNDTAVTLSDSSVSIDGCEFAGRNQGVWFTMRSKNFVNIRVRNSLFWKNTSGLSIAVDSTENGIQSRVVLEFKDTIFRDNFVVSGVDSGNLINMQSSVSVTCDLKLSNVTFTNNLVSRMGLVYVNLMNGHQNVFLKDVVVAGNNHLCPFGDCTELIMNGYSVSATIGQTYFSGLSGRALKVTTTNLSAHVYDSSFSAYGVNGVGGALLFQATDFANLLVVNSSFVKTAAFGASKGGAVYIQCPDSTVTFHKCVFEDNKGGSGGAISVTAFRHLPMSLDNIAKENRSFSKWNTETLLAVYINDCIFKSVNSYSAGGGAVSVIAPKLSVSVRNSTFRSCRSYGDGGALFIGSLSQITESAFLYMEKSYFLGSSSDRGRGGAVFVKSLRLVNVTIKRSEFVLSSASGYGGALAFFIPKTGVNIAEKDARVGSDNCITIESSSFISSAASAPGGAIFIDDVSAEHKITIKNTTFANNTAAGPGGAISSMIFGSAVSRVGSKNFITIESSRFLNNTAFAAPGGAIYIDSARTDHNLTIKSTCFKKNNAGGPGGAVNAVKDTERDLHNGSANFILIEDSCFLHNLATAPGGAISFYNGRANQNITMKGTSFINNNSTGRGGAISVDNGTPGNYLTINDTTFIENVASQPGGGAFFFLKFSNVMIVNVTFKNCKSAVVGGAMYLNLASKSVIVVEGSLFLNNSSPTTPGGALYIEMPWDTLEDAGCINKSRSSVSVAEEAKKFPKWDYITKLFFKNATFKYNTALFGGALYLHRGKTTFENCSFQDNFASAVGGTIYAAERSTSVIVHESSFQQSKTELIRNSQTFSKSSFIHTESTGPLLIQNTTLNARLNAVGNSLVTVGKGGNVDFGDDNSTQLYCPVGSQMQFLNFSNTITSGTKDAACTIRVTGLDYSCVPCVGGLYSLQRGQVHGTHIKSGFECLICPFGANCSENIVAKPNFWGFEESHVPPSLKFTICPPGYCGPNEQEDILDYNSCQGNRSGILCGQCKPGFTETLYSTCCRPVFKCRDYWFWPVAALYILIVALYLTFKPPFLSWIKRQTLWFKESTPATQEPDFDRGYLKIAFYFYQVGDLLLVSSSSQSLIKSYFVETVVGLFNFQQKFSSSSGFICPFPGFTVVTKRLFSTFHVFGTLVTICLLYSFHLGFQLIRGRDAPSAGSYLGGFLQILLLGYSILGSVSFDLLRCVPIGSEWRLFYDGNVVCYQWWQYVLIAFVVIFIVPFGFVLFWGALKLHREALSVRMFLLACIFPVPFLIHWILTALIGSSNDGNLSSSQIWTASIEKVLYDPFKRPEDGKGGSLNWESVLIGRRLVLIIMKAVISDPLSRLMLMTFFSFLVLLHHLAKKPFRDPKANTVETISLLSLIVLGMVNLFPASFLSLAVTSTGPFGGWLNFCLWVELLVLGFVPALVALLVMVFTISQACRLIFYVCRFVYYICGFCSAVGCCRFGNREAELLIPVT